MDEPNAYAAGYGSSEHQGGTSSPTSSAAGPPLDPPRRQRGVRLSDLDRGHLWVIGHTGRRWETLGTVDELLATDRDLRMRPDAGGRPEAGTAPDAPPARPR